MGPLPTVLPTLISSLYMPLPLQARLKLSLPLVPERFARTLQVEATSACCHYFMLPGCGTAAARCTHATPVKQVADRLASHAPFILRTMAPSLNSRHLQLRRLPAPRCAQHELSAGKQNSIHCWECGKTPHQHWEVQEGFAVPPICPWQ